MKKIVLVREGVKTEVFIDLPT